MPTEAEVLAAAKAVLVSANAKPYTLQEIEDAPAPPAYYTEVSVYQILSDGPRTTDEPSPRTQWRILTRAVGELYDNAQLMRSRAAVLDGAALTVGADTFHCERSISDDAIGPDDGWWSGISEYVC